MNQYDDGSFGAIFSVKEMLEFLKRGIPDGLVCTHWGTEQHLEDVRKGKQADVDLLKERVDAIEGQLEGRIITISPEIVKILEGRK